ncbi:MAG TPA: hypothetical protein VIQ31_17025 [Phormidium sp.]
MSSPEIYKGWIIEARPVFCVEVWNAGGKCFIPVHNAKNAKEALKMAKRWIDMQLEEEQKNSEVNDDITQDFDDDDMPF